jgi:hypothetical protein
MCCDLDRLGVTSKADWLLDLSDRARGRGDVARADHLALLAWLAYDGQTVDLDMITDTCAGFSKQAA